MRKILLTAFILALATPAWAAQQSISTITTKQSREELRGAINTELGKVQSNTTELYSLAIAAPWLAQATAPSVTNVFWIDTSAATPVIKYYDGDSWEPATSTEGGTYVLPTASATTLGGVKVGPKLTITDGVLSADSQVSDTAYGVNWNNDTTTAPSKNAIYDKIETIAGGTMTYPGVGVAKSTGSAWDTSYTVGTGANNLVQLNASSQLPAVSGALLTDSFTGTLLNGITTHKSALQTIANELDSAVEITEGTGIDIAAGVVSVDMAEIDADYPTWAGITPGAGVGTFLATPSSANLATAITDETGSGAAVFGTSPTIATPAVIVPEIDGSASRSLSAAQVSSTIVTNRGQATSDVALTLPTAAAGYSALFTVGTAQSNKWGVRAGTNDKIYLLAADGTLSAGSDNGYARMTAAQIGQSFACWTFQTGSSAWDWQCKAISIGTSTFAAN